MSHATFTASQHYRRAAEGADLSPSDRDQLSADQLFALALTGRLLLGRQDRDRLRPLHLAHLAVMELIDLETDERERIPADLLFELLVRGFTSLAPEELCRFTAEQRAAIAQLEAIKPASEQALQVARQS
ncbi:MAG: hypothetical protein WD845_10705 [Pirellulales bacterium]